MASEMVMLPTATVTPVRDGDYLVYPDGRRIKAAPEVRTVNDQTQPIGTTPPVGSENRAGANIFKAQAIEHIVNERGKGGGSNPNAWDPGDIGWWGKSQGVTVTDLQNLENTINLPELERIYNPQLIEAGVMNADGTQRTVQWGDTAESLDNSIASQTSNTLKIDQANDERFKIESDLAARSADNVVTNTATQNAAIARQEGITEREKIRADERRQADELRAWEADQSAKNRVFEMGVKELDNKASMDRYELEMARLDAKDRKDSIAALIAGLASLGTGFMI